MSRGITNRTREIALFFIQNPTMTQKAIAEHFGVHETRIGRVLRHPRVTKEFPILARKVMRDKILPKALERYERLIEKSQNDAVVEKAAGRVLASEGVFEAPTMKVEGEITFKSVQALKQIVSQGLSLDANEAIEAEIVSDNDTDNNTGLESNI